MSQYCSMRWGRSRPARRRATARSCLRARTGPWTERSNVRGMAAKRAVLLPHAQGVLALLEGPHAAVPAVAALDQLQLVEVGAVHGVVGVGPAEVVVEGDAEEGKAHQGGAVGVQARRLQLHLEPGRHAAPGQVRVGQQHGAAAGRAGGRHGPGVGARSLPAHRRPGLTAGDEGEVDHPLHVGDDVLGLHRQHLPPIGVEPIRKGPDIVVDPGGEGLQAGAHPGALLRVPVAGPGGHAHGAHVLVPLEIAVPPVLGRPSPRLPVELQQQVAVGGHLGPAEGVEHPRRAGGEDVGHAPGVPQDLGRRRLRGLRRGPRSAAADGQGQARQHDEPHGKPPGCGAGSALLRPGLGRLVRLLRPCRAHRAPGPRIGPRRHSASSASRWRCPARSTPRARKMTMAVDAAGTRNRFG